MSDILAKLVAYRAANTPSDPLVCRLLDEAIHELRRLQDQVRALEAELINLGGDDE